MQSTRAKILVLVALVALWALILVYRSSGKPPLRAGSDQPRARAPRAAAEGAVPRLKTELLKAARPPYPSDVHNIFSNPPPPPPAQAVGAAGPAGPAAPPPPPPDPFQEGAKQLRYVGFLKWGDNATAFLVRGQEVHTIQRGELLGGQFRVVEVGENDVLLGSPTGDKQVRLPIVGEGGTVSVPASIAAPGHAPQVGPPRPPGAIPRPGPLPGPP